MACQGGYDGVASLLLQSGAFVNAPMRNGSTPLLVAMSQPTPDSRVYFTVFAGRRRFLAVLMAYVQPLLEQRVIEMVASALAEMAATMAVLAALAAPAGLG